MVYLSVYLGFKSLSSVYSFKYTDCTNFVIFRLSISFFCAIINSGSFPCRKLVHLFFLSSIFNIFYSVLNIIYLLNSYC